MPKAYWVAQVTVHDPERYALYAKGAGEAFARHGGIPLARGGAMHWLEGSERPRGVIIEFASVDDATACYRSPEYQAARRHREAAAEFHLVIVEGLETAG
ncbi:DUF1330 domain-containing protein [Azospirillum sp. ST 5-10]|uniref:DUF1330 domain-containing protein n=1 Tax=unclassified Azospirillum TaxID=2630922 RepID=UPI003F49FACB